MVKLTMNLLLLSRSTSLLLAFITLSRTFHSTSSAMNRKGLLLGAFEKGKNESKSVALTNSASKFDSDVAGKLSKLIEV